MNKKTIKSITAATMVLAFGGLSAFAQNEPKGFKEKVPEKRVEKNQEENCQEMKLDTVRGKINVTGKEGNKTVTITTADKKVYTLTTMSFKNKMRKNPEAKTLDKEPEERKEDERREKPGDGEESLMQELISKKGKTVTLNGFLNKESSVFTVVKTARQTDFSNVK